MHLVLHFGKWNLRIDHEIGREMMERAARFYRHVDSALVQHSDRDAISLQTTLTAVFGAGRDLFLPMSVIPGRICSGMVICCG